MTRLLVAMAMPLAFGAPGVVLGTGEPTDQVAADAAVLVFNERLTAAGWSSAGPFTESAPVDDEATNFGGCLNGFEHYLDYTDVHVEGETARAYSHSFEHDSSEPVPTDSIGDYGYAGAVVLTVDDSAVGLLDTFVAQLGDPDTVACMMEQPTFDEVTDVRITNAADIGVGEASARLDFALSMRYQGTEFAVASTYAAARVDRSLVVVVAGGSGSAAAGLDPIAELAAMVESFG
jgi:hypothetical protein